MLFILGNPRAECLMFLAHLNPAETHKEVTRQIKKLKSNLDALQKQSAISG